MKKILLTALVLAGFSATAQVKVGSNPTTLATDANFQVEATDGTQFFINKPNGNVGIGTTTPTAQLQIGEGTGEQGIKVYGGDSSQKYLTLGTSETDRWSIVTNGLDNSFILYGNHTADGNGIKLPFLITRYGRVGIGNNINDVINDIYSDLQVGRGALGTSGHIVIHGGNDSQAALSLGTSLTDRWHIISQPNNSLTIGEDHSSDGGQTEANITINPGGNVGIGTSTPNVPLAVGNTFSTSTGASIKINNSLEFDFDGVNGTQRHARITPTSDISGGAYGGGLSLERFYDNGGSYTFGPVLTIAANGNVGIGTITPVSKLHVVVPPNGSNDVEVARFRTEIGSQNPGLFISVNEGTGVTAIDFSGSTGYSGSIKTGGVENIRTLSNGNVGIGTTAPTSKLQVVGLPVHADNAAATTAGLTAGAFYHAGDGIVRVVF